MEIGACPRCQRSYTVSEVAGFGILRARSASAGGPRVEYACPGCGHKLTLIPYGDGRYALPGEPPPPAAPPQQRRPPWIAGEGPAAARQGAGPASSPPPPDAPPEPDVVDVPLEEVDEDDEAPVGLREALALLGCSPAADREEIEAAFRERSRTCHPDKVAHLDAEFQALAERKFKRLRKAYDLLLS